MYITIKKFLLVYTHTHIYIYIYSLILILLFKVITLSIIILILLLIFFDKVRIIFVGLYIVISNALSIDYTINIQYNDELNYVLLGDYFYLPE